MLPQEAHEMRLFLSLSLFPKLAQAESSLKKTKPLPEAGGGQFDVRAAEAKSVAQLKIESIISFHSTFGATPS